MTWNRKLMLGGLLCAAGAAGVVTVMATGSPASTSAALPKVTPPKAEAPAPAGTVADKPAQDPRCAGEDKDDDAKEQRDKKLGKPDDDDVELQCGDQEDDDAEIEDDDDRPAPQKRASETAGTPAGHLKQTKAPEHR